MLKEDIGLENLPNLFIRSIDISKQNDKKTIIDINIIAKDILSNGSYQWFDDLVFKNFVNISVVFSQDRGITNNITNGILSLNKKDIFKNSNEKLKNISYLNKSVKNSSPPVYAGKDQNGDEIYEFSYRFTYVVDSEPTELSVFAAMTLNNEDLQKEFNLDPNIINYSFYQGPITSEIVYQSGRINKKSFYFTNERGQIWKGPVHMHDNKYMAGAFHTDSPHDTLQLNTISNFKINNTADNTELNENKSFAKEKNIFYFGNFWDSFDQSGDLDIFFNLDIEKIYLDKSNIGSTIKNKTPSLFAETLMSFEIKKIKVTRVSVNKNTRQRFESKIVFIGNFDNNEGHGTIKKMDLLFNKIKFFEFTDEEFKSLEHGNYVYDFEFTFVDRTQATLKQKIDKYKQDIYSLNKYYNRSIKKQNYNIETETFKANFTSRERNIFGQNYEDLTEKINNFLELKNYIYNFGADEKTNMYFDIFSRVNPVNGKPKNILNLIEEYNSNLNIFASKLTILSIKNKQKLDNNKKSFTLSTNNGAKISYNYKKVFSAADKKTGYVVFDKTKKLSHSEYDNKVINERERFFITKPSLTKDDRKNLKSNEIEALSDITTFSNTFFSPVALKSKGKKIDLSRTSLVNDGLLNEAINGITSPRTSAVGKRITFMEADTELKTNDGDTVFEKSNDYLGENSKINNVSFDYTLRELQEQKNFKTRRKIEYPIVQKSKRKNISTKFDISKKNNTIFNKVRNAPNLLGVRRLPNQYKSLVFSKSDTVRSTVLNNPNDLLSNPETSNKMFIQFFNIKIVEYLDGFELDTKGNTNVKKPIWKMLDAESKESIKGKDVFCRIRNYNDKQADIEVPEFLDFQIYNKYFVLTAEDISEISSADAQQNFDNSLRANIDFTTSNIVTQSSKINGSMKPTTQPTAENNTSQPTTTRARRNSASTRRIY